MWQCTVEIMFLISWILLVSIELMEIRRSVTRTGFPFVYIFDVGNTLDWLNYGSTCWSICGFLTSRKLHHLKLKCTTMFTGITLQQLAFFKQRKTWRDSRSP